MGETEIYIFTQSTGIILEDKKKERVGTLSFFRFETNSIKLKVISSFVS